jgi:hypothetical protein
MKEQIKQIIDMGGQVSFSFKKSFQDWMGEASVRYSTYSNSYLVNIYKYEEFDTADEAISYFIKHVISKDNYGLIFNGLEKHKIASKDLDDYTDQQLKEMCKIYIKEYFDKDYPNV